MKNIIKIMIKTIIFTVIISLAIYIAFRNLIFPRKYQHIVEQAATKYNVDPNLIYAIIKQESKFNEHAISKSNAKGLMQLVDSTASEFASEMDNVNKKDYDIYDPYTNIFIGTKYISYLTNHFSGNYYIALCAYNAGMGKVKTWFNKPYTSYKDYVDIIEQVKYNETIKYVTNVIEYYYYYTKLYK